MEVKSSWSRENIKVAVLSGGIGSERDVSLASGEAVAGALAQAGCEVVTAQVSPESLEILDDKTVDVFFPALHGQFGEDGQIQRIMEQKGLVYCGSGPRASELAFDKLLSKELFAQAGITTPPWIAVGSEDSPADIAAKLDKLGPDVVVKPPAQGSSVGVTICRSKAHAVEAAGLCFERFGQVMIEKFISGRELTVGIFDNHPLDVIEIVPKADFYDYNAKYVDNETQFLFDTIEGYALNANFKSAAMNCFEALGARQFARVDFIMDANQITWALEVNTIPGFTDHSLLPKAAQRAGMSMPVFCRKIVELALEQAKDGRAV